MYLADFQQQCQSSKPDMPTTKMKVILTNPKQEESQTVSASTPVIRLGNELMQEIWQNHNLKLVRTTHVDLLRLGPEMMDKESSECPNYGSSGTDISTDSNDDTNNRAPSEILFPRMEMQALGVETNSTGHTENSQAQTTTDTARPKMYLADFQQQCQSSKPDMLKMTELDMKLEMEAQRAQLARLNRQLERKDIQYARMEQQMKRATMDGNSVFAVIARLRGQVHTQTIEAHQVRQSTSQKIAMVTREKYKLAAKQQYIEQKYIEQH
jgi:hypothetical protein